MDIKLALRNWLSIWSFILFLHFFICVGSFVGNFVGFLLDIQSPLPFEFNPEIEMTFLSRRKTLRVEEQRRSFFIDGSRKWLKYYTLGFCYLRSPRHFLDHHSAEHRSEQFWAQTSPCINGTTITVRRHSVRRAKLSPLNLFRGVWPVSYTHLTLPTKRIV